MLVRWQLTSLARSIHRRAGELDDRRPLGEFGLDEVLRLLRAAAKDRVDPGILQPLDHGRIVERSFDRAGKLVDNRRRGAGWREDRVPGVALEAFQPLLLQGRQLW